MCMFHRFVTVSVLASLAGCNNSVPSSPTSSAQPATYTVSGIVSQTVDGVSRPIAGRSVRIWVEPDKREQYSTTDPNGRYTTQVRPNARVFLWASISSFDQQPCIASGAVAKDTTVDVEVFPLGTSAKPPSAASPLITGFAFETTPQGRRPVRASAQLELTLDNFVAWARTDDSGRFFFCRVNTPVRMAVAPLEPELKDSFSQSIPGAGDVDFEIEFKR